MYILYFRIIHLKKFLYNLRILQAVCRQIKYAHLERYLKVNFYIILNSLLDNAVKC